MRIFILIGLAFSGLLAFGQQKQVCFTFDDLPIVSYGIKDTVYQKKLVEKLVSSLNENKVPAIGFVNEGGLYVNDTIDLFKIRLLKTWANAGLDLGNHTFSHPDYNSTSFKEYSLDILKGETITKEILKKQGKPLTYFRHPFLHAGNSKLKADSLTEFLVSRGYKVAPVTIDNDDYLFALAYKRSSDKKDTRLKLQIGRDYVDYMERKLTYYENQANRLFGRPINQILLLHASSLNSDFTESLISMFKKNNYTFINMNKAIEDPVFKTNITVYGKWGISWLDRWALSQGKKGDFFKDEPTTPDYIVNLAK